MTSQRTSLLVSFESGQLIEGDILTRQQRLLPFLHTLSTATHMDHLAEPHLATAVSLMATMAVDRRRSNNNSADRLPLRSSTAVLHLSNHMASHHSSTAALLRAMASRPRVTVKATLSSSTTRVLQHHRALLHHTVLLLQCRQAGPSSGIRTASAGCKSSLSHPKVVKLTLYSYIEQATGRTQWDPPSNLPPGPYAPPGPNPHYVASAAHDERALFGNTHGHSGHDYNTAPGAPADPAKKDKGHSTGMLAAAGIGGIAAGALLGHALSTSTQPQPHVP